MIINLYKPTGITSFDCIRIIKFIFKYPEKFADNNDWQKIIKEYKGGKIGHAGTLDPFAEGVLIICTDQDTKNISLIQAKQKEYVANIKLGFTSDTYDLDGHIVQTYHGTSPCDLNMNKISKILYNNFTGEILQTPPIFSAKKINGKRAYDLARQGISVKLEPKKVIIYNIDVNNYNFPNLELTINCSSGTYIRSIAHDLGQLLKIGAYCHSLTRTKIGDYHIDNSISLPKDQVTFYQNK
jgi:tRNA pseudouridine55 synthase